MGNLYFTDSGNFRVRKIDLSTNIITTVLGGGYGVSVENVTATNVKLQSPQGIWVDTVGNIYFTDVSQQRIRKFVAKSGRVFTFAGTGLGGYSGDNGLAVSSQVNSPYGLWGDTNGRFFIADYGNYRVRMVNLNTSIISTFAGNGLSGFNADYISATLARLSAVYAVIGDSAGNIYIADSGNGRVRMVSPVNSTFWMISTLIGGGSGTWNSGVATLATIVSIFGLWMDTSYNIYVSEGYRNRVRVSTIISNPTGQPSRQPTGQQLVNLFLFLPGNPPDSLPLNQPASHYLFQHRGPPINPLINPLIYLRNSQLHNQQDYLFHFQLDFQLACPVINPPRILHLNLRSGLPFIQVVFQVPNRQSDRLLNQVVFQRPNLRANLPFSQVVVQVPNLPVNRLRCQLRLHLHTQLLAHLLSRLVDRHLDRHFSRPVNPVLNLHRNL